MEVPFAIFAGLMGLAPFGLIGAILAYQSHVTERRNRVWAKLARELGLQASKDSVRGFLEGRPVQLRIVWRGSGKHRHMWTEVFAGHSLPLDLGISVSPHVWLFEAIGAVLGAHDVTIGDPQFDAAFTINADEPARAAVLLSPPLRSLLMAARSDTPLQLHDNGVVITRRGGVEAEPWLRWALAMVARANLHVEQARAYVPPAAALEPLRREWARFANETGLALTTTPLCLYGRLGGIDVSAYAVRSGPHAYQLEVFVRHPDPLGIGLMVRPAGVLDGVAAFLGGQDLVLGDPWFDQAFVVQAFDLPRARQALDAETRARVFDINQRVGRIQVRDDGISVRLLAPARSPADVPRIVEALKDVCERIHRNARGAGGAGGAYR